MVVLRRVPEPGTLRDSGVHRSNTDNCGVDSTQVEVYDVESFAVVSIYDPVSPCIWELLAKTSLRTLLPGCWEMIGVVIPVAPDRQPIEEMLWSLRRRCRSWSNTAGVSGGCSSTLMMNCGSFWDVPVRWSSNGADSVISSSEKIAGAGIVVADQKACNLDRNCDAEVLAWCLLLEVYATDYGATTRMIWSLSVSEFIYIFIAHRYAWTRYQIITITCKSWYLKYARNLWFW